MSSLFRSLISKRKSMENVTVVNRLDGIILTLLLQSMERFVLENFTADEIPPKYSKAIANTKRIIPEGCPQGDYVGTEPDSLGDIIFGSAYSLKEMSMKPASINAVCDEIMDCYKQFRPDWLVSTSSSLSSLTNKSLDSPESTRTME